MDNSSHIRYCLRQVARVAIGQVDLGSLAPSDLADFHEGLAQCLTGREADQALQTANALRQADALQAQLDLALSASATPPEGSGPKANPAATFTRRTDAIASQLCIGREELPAVLRISKRMFYGYRSGRYPVSHKAWRKLRDAEKEVAAK